MQHTALDAPDRIVWRHTSPPQSDIVRGMWLRSDNLIAETLLERIGLESQTSGDVRQSGLQRELQLLQTLGVDTQSPRAPRRFRSLAL